MIEKEEEAEDYRFESKNRMTRYDINNDPEENIFNVQIRKANHFNYNHHDFLSSAYFIILSFFLRKNFKGTLLASLPCGSPQHLLLAPASNLNA